ncbi:MAG: FtsX-like permease family protein [Acidobacteria bacterium]|nr:FtsX-like permease family protein [Acidobacteriota bacterium]
MADPRYLNVTGARLRRGRFFEATDDETHPMTAVVNEAFLREHFPGEEALGRRIVVFGAPREIVGVIGDIRYAGPGAPVPPTMYFPLLQQPWPEASLLVRTVSDNPDFGGLLRRAVLSADSDIAPFEVTTVEDSLAHASARERLVVLLLAGFGMLALLLAIVGVHGVQSYVAGRLRREIALRIALGAGPNRIFFQVAGGAVGRACAGVVAGLALFTTATVIGAGSFPGLAPDLWTYTAVAALLILAAFSGAAVPAWRAAAADPSTVLRDG